MPINENKLFKSLCSFIESSNSLYLISFDEKDNFTYVNQLYKKHFSHVYTNFIGEKITKDMYPESVQLFLDCKEKNWINISDDKAIKIRKKGTELNIDIYIKWDFFPIHSENGKVTEVGGIGYCMTEYKKEKEEHKRTLQKLKMALNNVEESFYFIDKNYKVISFNNIAQQETEYFVKIKMHEGFDFREIVSKDRLELFEKRFLEVLKGKTISYEFQNHFDKIKPTWYRHTMKPFKDINDNIIGVIFSSINIEEAKRKEERLKEIAWHQSHKVRKPLSNILGLVNLLKDEKNPSQKNELINMLDESAQELDIAIKDIIAKTI
ncbi:MAG: PAS domain-containing protein [Chitinophagales bacterium]|nr:PAS domain-containing protein [Chitinophagales bacterium]